MRRAVCRGCGWSQSGHLITSLAPWAVLGLHAQLRLAGQHLVARHLQPCVADDPMGAFAHHLHGLADQLEWHRVAVALDADQPVLGHHTLAHHGVAEAGLAGRGRQMSRLLLESVDGPLVRGAMDAHVGHLGLPGAQLLIEVVQVAEGTPRHEVALDILHARLDLALGLGAIGLAQPDPEAPMLSKGLEGGVEAAALAIVVHHGAHAVEQQALAAAAEVGEGMLVRGQQVVQPLVQEAFGIAASAIAQRHDEDVHPHDLLPEVHLDLSPVNLGLLAWLGLKAALGECRCRSLGSQGPNCDLDHLIAAVEVPLQPQLLVEDARREVDLRGALAEPGHVLIELGRTRRAAVRPPVLAVQGRANRLAVQPHLSCDGRDGLAPSLGFAYCLPLCLPNHVALRVPGAP
ncbi:Hypothetical protein mma_2800 [Janthinobacterium sp. Marseille]|nr:Hypothetical protein mma_2800 [Janthinobacterium sp. Marseille]